MNNLDPDLYAQLADKPYSEACAYVVGMIQANIQIKGRTDKERLKRIEVILTTLSAARVDLII